MSHRPQPPRSDVGSCTTCGKRQEAKTTGPLADEVSSDSAMQCAARTFPVWFPAVGSAEPETIAPEVAPVPTASGERIHALDRDQASARIGERRLSQCLLVARRKEQIETVDRISSQPASKNAELRLRLPRRLLEEKSRRAWLALRSRRAPPAGKLADESSLERHAPGWLFTATQRVERHGHVPTPPIPDPNVVAGGIGSFRSFG